MASMSPSKSENIRWILFVHQLPARPSNLRVRIWRKIQQAGAVPIKNSVYLLPDREECREIFQWLAQEVKDAGGDAAVFHSRTAAELSDREIISEFQKIRALDYGDVIKDLRKMAREMETLSSGGGIVVNSVAAMRHRYKVIRSRLEKVREIDFFESPNRREAFQLAEACRTSLARLSGPSPRAMVSSGDDLNVVLERSRFHNRVWVTRPGLHIDRLASAWLIRRFVDPRPTFRFVKNQRTIPGNAVPFDMAGVPFGHHGEDCSFETFLRKFQLTDTSLRAIGDIVHDADLRDEKFGRSETPGLDAVISGLTGTVKDDKRLIELSTGIFDALFEHFKGHGRAPGGTSR